MSKCTGSLSIFGSSTRSHKAIEGVRTVLILIVLMHHLDILNPALLKDNILWDASPNDKQDQRRLLKASNIFEAGQSANLSVLGTLVYVFNGYLSVTLPMVASSHYTLHQTLSPVYYPFVCASNMHVFVMSFRIYCDGHKHSVSSMICIGSLDFCFFLDLMALYGL
eukprot:184135_1